jgi:hypothetical protein
MFNHSHALEILRRVERSLGEIADWTVNITSEDDFTSDSGGMVLLFQKRVKTPQLIAATLVCINFSFLACASRHHSRHSEERSDVESTFVIQHQLHPANLLFSKHRGRLHAPLQFRSE